MCMTLCDTIPAQIRKRLKYQVVITAQFVRILCNMLHYMCLDIPGQLEQHLPGGGGSGLGQGGRRHSTTRQSSM